MPKLLKEYSDVLSELSANKVSELQEQLNKVVTELNELKVPISLLQPTYTSIPIREILDIHDNKIELSYKPMGDIFEIGYYRDNLLNFPIYINDYTLENKSITSNAFKSDKAFITYFRLTDTAITDTTILKVEEVVIKEGIINTKYNILGDIISVSYYIGGNKNFIQPYQVVSNYKNVIDLDNKNLNGYGLVKYLAITSKGIN